MTEHVCALFALITFSSFSSLQCHSVVGTTLILIFLVRNENTMRWINWSKTPRTEYKPRAIVNSLSRCLTVEGRAHWHRTVYIEKSGICVVNIFSQSEVYWFIFIIMSEVFHFDRMKFIIFYLPLWLMHSMTPQWNLCLFLSLWSYSSMFTYRSFIILGLGLDLCFSSMFRSVVYHKLILVYGLK